MRLPQAAASTTCPYQLPKRRPDGLTPTCTCAPHSQAWNTFSLQDISTAAAPQPYWPPQSGTAYERRAVHAGTSGWEGELSRRLLAQMPQGGWLLRSLAARGFDGSTAALHRAVDRCVCQQVHGTQHSSTTCGHRHQQHTLGERQ